MESNAQTELTSKIETDSWIKGRLRALGWGWKDKKKGKRTHWHRQQCGDCGGQEVQGD